MAITDKLMNAYGKVFDVKRKTFIGESATLVLLKVKTDGYVKKADVLTGWFVEFDSYRGSMVLQIAATGTTIQTQTQGSSHIAYNGIVYQFRAGDGIPPTGQRPFWQFELTATGETWSEP